MGKKMNHTSGYFRFLLMSKEKAQFYDDAYFTMNILILSAIKCKDIYVTVALT